MPKKRHASDSPGADTVASLKKRLKETEKSLQKANDTIAKLSNKVRPYVRPSRNLGKHSDLASCAGCREVYLPSNDTTEECSTCKSFFCSCCLYRHGCNDTDPDTDGADDTDDDPDIDDVDTDSDIDDVDTDSDIWIVDTGLETDDTDHENV